MRREQCGGLDNVSARRRAATSTSDKILEIAQSLIARGGYNGFSYADISAVIGIRKASIYHHFPTKAELVAVSARALGDPGLFIAIMAPQIARLRASTC